MTHKPALCRNPERVEGLLTMVREGATFSAAAKAFGISTVYAARLCREHGVDRIPRVRQVLQDKGAAETIRIALENGGTLTALAEQFQVTKGQMSRIVDELGLASVQPRRFTRKMPTLVGSLCGTLRCVGPDIRKNGVWHAQVRCEKCGATKLCRADNFRRGQAGCAECRLTLGGRYNTPEGQMYMRAKRRAEESGIVFTIDIDDIDTPEVCPVLGIPLRKGTASDKDGSPSLDRIDSSRGYEPGNVWVISYRANRIKNDATLDELKRLVSALEKLQ